MSSKVLGLDAPRPTSRSNVLTLSSDARLNNNHDFATSSTPSRKRNHDSYAMEDLLKPSIVVKPYPPKLSTKPRSLQPLMLLPREHLALSCLDLASPLGDFQYARFYESTIKILDLEGRMGARAVVLIARLETDKTLYALERQDTNLYTLCKLGNWVDLEKISSHATVSYSKLMKPRVPAPPNAAQADATITPQIHRENKKRRLAIEAIQSLVKKPVRSQSISLGSQGLVVAQTPAITENGVASQSVVLQVPTKAVNVGSEADVGIQAGPKLGPDQEIAQPTADDIFNNVRTQYFEALYHSMGSLAYFAKGPLSRARAAFHFDCDSNLDMNDLIDFLKGLVLTTVQIDKKYRETVPSIIAKMKLYIPDSADEQSSKAKKRKPRKMRLGKDGLYPMEHEHIRKWWAVYKPQLQDTDSMTTEIPQETKLQISCLRSRETQLQMILILEILALEPLRVAANANDLQLPGLPTDNPPADACKEAVVKKRNKHSFPVLLDVHADRLSIWQSTSLDEVKMIDDFQTSQHREGQKSNRSTSDPLKDFCVDIIVPFFSSRLPDQCDSLNRKLGGPVMPSPPKSRPKKPKKDEAMIKPKAKPGAATKRLAAAKSVRTLDRVLSKESERNRRSMSRGPSSMIALMRSASTPTIPSLKRETSDSISLMNIATRDSQDSVSSNIKTLGSSTLGPAKRMSREEKAKRDAEVKAELQEAISSLRRPNRDVVGKAMAEAAERRATTSLSQLRKSKKPTQHHGFQNIVKATPVGPRFRDALNRDTDNQLDINTTYTESPKTERVPPSSFLVPSSAPRKRDRDMAFVVEESSPALPSYKTPTGIVDSTPGRPSALKRNFLSAPTVDEGVVIATSPVMPRKFLAVPDSSLKHRDSGISMPSSPGGGDLAETPMKKTRAGALGSLEGYVTVTPAKRRAVDHIITTPATSKFESVEEKEPGRKMSIYEKLGWDDDFDDLG